MIQKQSFPVNFASGLDLKTDPKQVQIGKFLTLQNSIFTTGGLLQKRNGFQNLITQSTPYPSSIATLNDGLVTIGSSIEYYSPDTDSLFNRGGFQPVDVSVIPAIRNSATQSTADVAIAPNGLACVVATDSQAGGIYQIIDSTTGNVVVPITALSGGSSPTPKVFLLGTYFIVTYTASDGTVLKYIAIPYATPTSPGSATTLAASMTAPGSYDGAVNNGVFYFAYNSTDNSGASFRVNTLSSSLVIGTSTVQDITSSYAIYNTSVAVDPSSGDVWVTVAAFDSGADKIFSSAFTSSLVNVVANAVMRALDELPNPGFTISSVVNGGLVYVFFTNSQVTQVIMSYSSCNLSGTVTELNEFVKGYVYPQSRPLVNPLNNTICLWTGYVSSLQATYFLLDINSNIIAKLAATNAGFGDPNYFTVMSSVIQNGTTIESAYLYQDQISSVNKSVNANGTLPSVGGIYSQAGVNLSEIVLGSSNTVFSEIAGSLQLSGGFLWMFDGQSPVEQNFHIWPENITTSQGTSGSMEVQQYFYQLVYEWTDGTGNIHRSAPSIPISVNLTSGKSSVELGIPNLGLTAKGSTNPVRIVVYRWSTANPIYYQVSSLTDTSGTNNLIINANDTVATYGWTDELADTSIVGNNILYTNGGVLEDSGAPSSSIVSLFDDRFWLVDAEDPNLLWFSKQVIESTPVEMSAFLTFYVAPTTSSEGSTGPISALAPMDDKLIIFKQNAIYYINGTGPDNTGANNQYSQPIFITSAVGCSVPNSIVFTPNGLMFQSNKGIWLLGRDLSTQYIGAPVEGYNQYRVNCALNVPETNQVRFALSNGTTLMFDYYFGQWGTFSDLPAISCCVYGGLHAFLNSTGGIYQENPGVYLDGTTPVLMSFTTGWIQLQGIAGYQRIYELQLTAQYFSPHLLTAQIGYDFYPLSETATIQPTNFNGVGSPVSSPEPWRIQFGRQKCQAFQFALTESYDSSFGIQNGAGFTLSAMTCTLGLNRGYRPVPATATIGTQ